MCLEIRFEGRQYSTFDPGWPQGFPVSVSFHFSFCQRFSDVPFLDLRTDPFFFRHFAKAWEARADGQVLYCALIL